MTMATPTTDTSTPPLRIAVVLGSARVGRFAPTVADWFSNRVSARPDIEITVIDVGAMELPHSFGEPVPGGDDIRAALAAADAFVIITPEYNHSYPAALKNLIDGHNREWHAKPVGFISYGGISGGLRAVEHLRGVFAELHAVTVRDTVSFHNPWGQIDEQGALITDPAADTAAKTLLDQLVWWGETLRAGRAARPYGR